MNRCPWAHNDDALMQKYHDDEWGVPVHDDCTLFEFLVLEGAQAGLSWKTILKRRGAYAATFYNFNPQRVACMNRNDVERLLGANSGIIRNRKKVESVIANAKAFLEIQKTFGSFDAFIWKFVDEKSQDGKRHSGDTLPAKTELSACISKILKQKGFSFVGPIIVYAYMQAIGMVNDHTQDCFRYSELVSQ